jgi:lysophospholipase L1-like esterase
MNSAVLIGDVKGFFLGHKRKIIFFGDSITELGLHPGGYIALIKKRLLKERPSDVIVGTGIGGNKVTDLLERVDRDVILRKPDITVIYIGINDVWHSVTPGLQGTPKSIYESGLKELIAKIRSTGSRVILCTPSVIGEKWGGGNQLDTQLEEYSEISRRVAQETRSGLCDLRKAFIEYLQIHNPANNESGILTTDSVHMNDEGNRLIAHELLKALD